MEDFQPKRDLDKAQRDAMMEHIQNDDPYAANLQRITKDPAHHLAYDYFLENAPKELKKPRDRQKYAYAKGLQLAQDQDAADAVYSDYAAGKFDEKALGDMLESVDSPDGQHFGMRVKPEARTRVRAMMEEQKARRLNLQEQRETRISQTAHDAQILHALDDQITDYRKAAENGTDDTAKEKLKKAPARREMLLDRLMGDSDKAPAGGAPGTAKPTTSEFNKVVR